MSSIMRPLLVSIAIGLALPVAVSSAARGDDYDLSIRAIPDDYSGSSLADGHGRSAVELKGEENSQEVLALTLDPGAAASVGDAYSVTSPEKVDFTDWRPIYYLSSHFGTLDGRLRATSGETDEDAERDAYQLAIWELVRPGLLASLPQTPTVLRAMNLVFQSQGVRVGSKDPTPARATLHITQSQRYLAGNKIQLRLSQADGSGIANQLVEIAVNGQVKNEQVTNDSGNATVDLPSDDPSFLGTITAQWRSKLPPGTFLTSHEGQWLTLVGASPILTGSNSYINAAPSSRKETVSILGQLSYRWLNKYAPPPLVYGVLLILVLGTALGFAKRAQKLTGVTFVVVALIGLVLCLIAGYAMAKAQEQEFNLDWTTVVEGKDSSLRVTSVLGSSKRNSSRYASAYNWPCVSDKSRTSPWISGPDQGPFETVALDLGKVVQVDSLEFTMGWPDADFDYYDTGQPSRLTLVGETGQADEIAVEPRDWSSWQDPVEVNLRSASRTPIRTRVLYIRVTSIVGGVKTNFGISDIRIRGFSLQDTATFTVGSDALSRATAVRASKGCGFHK